MDEIVNAVARSWNLPVEASKHERLILRKRRRKKRREVGKAQGLGVILDEP